MSAAPLDRFVLLLVASLMIVSGSGAQEQKPGRGEPDVSLRKSVHVREFRGRQVTGEERQIGRGDSMWRILIEEKGLSGKKFHSYLVVIRGLNPQVENLDLLRIGDKIFIPLRPDEIGAAPSSAVALTRDPGRSDSGRTISYRVKSGESLYRILREQFKLSDPRTLAQYASLVKDLNPQRKHDWDTLHEGEMIQLPALEAAGESASAEIRSQPNPQSSAPVVDTTKSEVPPAVPLDRNRALLSPAKANMPLLGSIVAALGGEIHASGEETIRLPDGTVHFDKSTYPVISNPVFRQRMVIDPSGTIPASLKAKLNDPSIGTPVLPLADGVSLQKAVAQLLVAMGYKPLPAERPVIVQEEGIAFEAKGDWMALGPEISNKTQDVFVINLTDRPDEIPDYLRDELAKLGLNLRAVALPRSGSAKRKKEREGDRVTDAAQIKHWPADKSEIVDALLFSFNVPFGVAETLSVEVRDGLRVDIRADRLFDSNGIRTALFFQATDPEIRNALERRHGVRAVALELGSLSSRELIARTLNVLGHPAIYREHRFPAEQGSAQDRLTLKAWGFNLPKRAMFVTDRKIPSTLHRFFFEKGLEIVYFR
jgi:hypothetical protein